MSKNLAICSFLALYAGIYLIVFWDLFPEDED